MNSDGCEITGLKWGRIEVAVAGQRQSFKDCKIWPGYAKEWDWALTGTRHKPGIQIADVEEVLASGIAVLVLTRGMELKLGTCPETVEYAKDHNVEVHILETKEAVKTYNELSRQGVSVGGVFHSTC